MGDCLLRKMTILDEVIANFRAFSRAGTVPVHVTGLEMLQLHGVRVTRQFPTVSNLCIDACRSVWTREEPYRA